MINILMTNIPEYKTSKTRNTPKDKTSVGDINDIVLTPTEWLEAVGTIRKMYTVQFLEQS
jgi:hypothetical protein